MAIATNYALHPSLEDVAADLDSSIAALGIATSATVAGYMLGLAVLTPTIDRFSPSILLPAEVCLLGVALAVGAVVESYLQLSVTLFVLGLLGSVAAQLSTLAGTRAAPLDRGLALGTVTAGISAGLLVGRIGGGYLAEALGWRAMLLVLAALCVACALALGLLLPRDLPTAPQPYLDAVVKLPGLLIRHHALRTPAAAGALWFFSFNLSWVGLSIALAEPPVAMSPAAIGQFGLAGLLGVLVTRPAGRWADTYGSRAVVLVGLAAAATGLAATAYMLERPVVVFVGLAVFDAGLFAAQVSNQSRVLEVDPARPGAVNGAYLLVYFGGGSIGAAVAPWIVSHWGWPATVFVGCGAVLAAAILTAHGRHSFAQASSGVN